jgi:hypothetical protein
VAKDDAVVTDDGSIPDIDGVQARASIGREKLHPRSEAFKEFDESRMFL